VEVLNSINDIDNSLSPQKVWFVFSHSIHLLLVHFKNGGERLSNFWVFNHITLSPFDHSCRQQKVLASIRVLTFQPKCIDYSLIYKSLIVAAEIDLTRIEALIDNVLHFKFTVFEKQIMKSFFLFGDWHFELALTGERIN
jgi:hypothetical protein